MSTQRNMKLYEINQCFNTEYEINQTMFQHRIKLGKYWKK